MKLLYISALLSLLAACNKTSQLQLTIKAPEIKNGVVILKQANEQLLSRVIRDGEMEVERQLVTPGYYTISIIDSDKPLLPKHDFDVYLQNGKYLIETIPGRLQDYPRVTTTVAIQNQLSDYYRYANQRAAALDDQIDAQVGFLKSAKAAALTKQKRAQMYFDTRAIQKKRRELDLDILRAYTEKHPQNIIGAHIMAQQYYPENPNAYYDIFQKFSQGVKTSDDGLRISNKLNTLLGVMEAAIAPNIVGQMPNGRPFNKSQLKNKITLVEFWLSSYRASTLNHQKMVNGIIVSDYDRVKFGIVSVSLDTVASEWKKTIQQDQLKWPQVSDLKGDKSPNVKNWNITKLPTYFLVDKDWHIIKADIDLLDVDETVHRYFKKHPTR